MTGTTNPSTVFPPGGVAAAVTVGTLNLEDAKE
jgi:hypothetical protein